MGSHRDGGDWWAKPPPVLWKRESRRWDPSALQSAENLWKCLAAMRSFIAGLPAAGSAPSAWNQVPEPWASSRKSLYVMHSSSIQASRLIAEARPQTDFFFHPWRTTERATRKAVQRPHPNYRLLRETSAMNDITLSTMLPTPESLCACSITVSKAGSPPVGRETHSPFLSSSHRARAQVSPWSSHPWRSSESSSDFVVWGAVLSLPGAWEHVKYRTRNKS